jgi:hypothetical protein
MAQLDWQSSILIFLGGIGFGGVVVAIVNHRLTGERDRKAKVKEFSGLLGRWLGVLKEPPKDYVSKVHATFVEALWGYYATLYKDFFRKRRFRALCEDLGSIKPEDLEKNTNGCREVFARRIEKLIRFL